jgi:hypothetical protein
VDSLFWDTGNAGIPKLKYLFGFKHYYNYKVIMSLNNNNYATVSAYAAAFSSLSQEQLETYDGIVRSAIKEGASIEDAVNCADYSLFPQEEYEPFYLYIPRAWIHTSKLFVEQMLGFIGKIRRVDFVQIKNFNTKETNDKYKRVFVHFDNLTAYGKQVTAEIIAHGSFHLIVGADNREFWNLREATNHVDETELNIHQLAHTYGIIDDKVIDLEHAQFQSDVLVEELQDKNDALEEKVADLQQVVLSMQQQMQDFVLQIQQMQQQLVDRIENLEN